MTYRCPYCREVFDAGETSVCPHCRRAFLKPTFFAHAPSGNNDQDAAPESPHARQRSEPFTLLRRPMVLPLFIAILLVSGGLVLSRTRQPAPSSDTSKRDLAWENLGVLRLALDLWQTHCGRYPDSHEGLAALVRDPGAPGWRGPYILELKPDPWERPFVYRSDTTNITLYSLGPDGRPQTSDDIHSAPPTEALPGASAERSIPATLPH